MVAHFSETSIEVQTQAIARDLLAAMPESRSWLAQLRGWDDKLLAWTMGNPGLRVQLFRFIDCLPALRSKAEIARLLQEYLSDSSVELPAALKGVLNYTQPDSIPAQMAASTVTAAVGTLAQKYIAGETVQQTLKTIEGLRKQRMAFTIDLLGEAVITELEAQAYQQRYLQLLEDLTAAAKKWSPIPQVDEADGESLPRVQVSVKLTAFYSQFDPLDAQGSQARVSEAIRTVLRRSHSLGAAVHFDMEQFAYKAITLETLKEILLEEEFRHRADVGVTLQAYLRDSEDDLRDLIVWAKHRGTPVTVRLVKGAYWDQETILAAQKDWPQPVFNHKAATDANFETLTRILLEHHDVLYGAIGSHNVRSQARAIALAQALKVPQRAFELQVLYGMGDRLATALVAQGHRVRVYCPFGELLPGMAYLIRRLLENTANSSFLRQSLEDRPVEELIQPPTLSHPSVTHPEVDHRPRQSGFHNAADTDFSLAHARGRSHQALQRGREQLGKTYWPLINGTYQTCETLLDSVNPSNPAEVIGQIGLGSIEQADQAIHAAKVAFPSWRKTPVGERVAILRKAADLMEERRAELVAWIVLEVGKAVREADGEVSEAIDFCRYYGDEMERLEQGVHYDYPGETNRYHYQPRGIAVVISPWNFPLAIPTGMVVAALVTGNCTVLKPAETSSVIGAKLTEILVAAGMPAGVFQFLPGKGSLVGAHLVNHPDVHLITFTGSQAVGCRIYAEAAQLRPGQRHMKRVIAEMGGKNGVIVDESADLDQAVAGVVQSAFGYSGQKCSACSRVIVLAPIYEAFVNRLVEAARSLNVGPADVPSTTVGPVIDATAQARILEMIAQARSQGRVVLEMDAPKTGYFVGPVIIADVPPDAALAQEEIFGPVLAVLRATSFDEALAIANNTRYALTGGLFSRTPSHIQRAEREFEVGNLYINRTITGAIVARQPFGGFKLSGVGSKAGGPDYLLQFLEPRTITENIQRQGFAPIEGAE